MPSVHPRCSQHSLVAPDGMCVLCRRQASSGPPAAQQQPAQPSAAAPREATTNQCAALLVGVALLTLATTYLIDTVKNNETAASQRAEAQRESAEMARIQALALAAAQADDYPVEAPAAPSARE